MTNGTFIKIILLVLLVFFLVFGWKKYEEYQQEQALRGVLNLFGMQSETKPTQQHQIKEANVLLHYSLFSRHFNSQNEKYEYGSEGIFG